jgi:hypothetical protein
MSTWLQSMIPLRVPFAPSRVARGLILGGESETTRPHRTAHPSPAKTRRPLRARRQRTAVNPDPVSR